MKVFKFGGASVKDAGAIKNLGVILNAQQEDCLVVVVSAMGKTTNALEKIVHARMNKEDVQDMLSNLKSLHFDTVNNLFPNGNDKLTSRLNTYFDQLGEVVKSKEAVGYDQLYDKVVSFGEYFSTVIVSSYLNSIGHNCTWRDAKEIIRTDESYREGQVDWSETRKLASQLIDDSKGSTIITQGFIGGTKEGQVTTLGREGSDFTAAILAASLDAESVTIWKDVPGILNADPKRIPEAILFSELPYTEASEMTYYGASVIHPKTIKPLANKGIPLFVKSFDNPEMPGTIIHECEAVSSIPCIIFKENQCLFSFKVLDFTFVNEDNLSKIFHELHELNIKINMMENSAISFSVVFDYDPIRVKLLKERLKNDYTFLYNKELTLITLKNSNEELEADYSNLKDIYLMQRSRKNVRFLVAEIA